MSGVWRFSRPAGQKILCLKVPDHYAKGFATLGFAQELRSSTLETETHECAEGRERFILKIAQKPKGGTVIVCIEAVLT